MKTTKEPQIKTIEKLIVRVLQKSAPRSPVQEAFRKMFNHFIDEDFLYTNFNESIINLIYEKNFYKNGYGYALPYKLNLDNKTLLYHRKHYLKLFAKYYLGLKYNSTNILLLLYFALKEEYSRLDSKGKA